MKKRSLLHAERTLYAVLMCLALDSRAHLGPLTMADLLYIFLTLVFSGALFGFVVGCDVLGARK